MMVFAYRDTFSPFGQAVGRVY